MAFDRNSWIAPVAAAVFGLVLGLLLYRFAVLGLTDLPAICSKADRDAVGCIRAWLGLFVSLLAAILVLTAAYIATRPVWHQFSLARAERLKQKRAALAQITRRIGEIAAPQKVLSDEASRIARSAQSAARAHRRAIVESSADLYYSLNEPAVSEASDAIDSVLQIIRGDEVAASIGIAGHAADVALAQLVGHLRVASGDWPEFTEDPAESYDEIRVESIERRNDFLAKMRDLRSAISNEGERVLNQMRAVERDLDRPHPQP